MLARGLPIALSTALLCACAAPDYTPSPSAAVARVRFTNVVRPHICTNGSLFALNPDSAGYVTLPAGHPVHLMGTFTRNSGICHPAVKFTPQSGEVYDFINEARAERCITTVMVHDTSAQYGVRLVPSTIQKPDSCR